MAIATRLSDYLKAQGTRYEIRFHSASRSSVESAHSAHVPPGQLAKSVVLEDEAGCMLAVLPADRDVMLGALGRLLGRPHLRLADEARVAALFADCRRGAVPALGMAWGIETLVDETLEAAAVVYIEGGDHVHLLRLTHDQFHDLMQPARHACFAGDRLH